MSLVTTPIKCYVKIDLPQQQSALPPTAAIILMGRLSWGDSSTTRRVPPTQWNVWQECGEYM
jgi:hypothetical protein